MARPAAVFAGLLAVTTTVAAHEGRRLFTQPQAHNEIWSRCDRYAPDGSGCYLKDLGACQDRLSDGPEDADVELTLGGLPPSRPGPLENMVHLHWWAAYASVGTYDPLDTIINCSIYPDYPSSYPKYWEPEFNGGNVQVDENGFATIRFRAPATYWVYGYCVAKPHVHMRVCAGSNLQKMDYDAVWFGHHEYFTYTKSQTNPILIKSARRYNSVLSADAVDYNIPEPESVITPDWFGIENEPDDEEPERTTTPRVSQATTLRATTRQPVAETPSATSAGGTTRAPGAETTSSARATEPVVETTTDGGTTRDPVVETTMSPEQKQTLIDEAMDAMDSDTLEFSPVYGCFLDNQFFSHFEDDCADSCPSEGAVAHGQCVREELGDSSAILSMKWALQIECGELCAFGEGHAQKIHSIRLAVAGHLDVPFQEVNHVIMEWEDTERRLSSGAAMQILVLTVAVDTTRHMDDTGQTLLSQLIVDSADASALVGMNVRTIVDIWEVSDEDILGLGQGTDPYEVAYLAAAPTFEGDAPRAEAGSAFWRVEAIGGVAAGVAVVGAALGALAWRCRRRGQPAGAVGKVVQEWVVDRDTTPEAKKENEPCQIPDPVEH